MYRKIGKRSIDILLSLIGIIVFAPFFLLIMIALLVTNSGKVFFIQERPGFKERSFRLIKFKTMNDQKDEKGNLLPNHIRTTSVGAFLRQTSLDEIPQLFNVLNGDMSLVGPRPLLFKYLPLYNSNQSRRHEVRPGITGWAQVNGRNTISWTKKFEYDVYYVDNYSLLLDFKILLLTVRKVLKREGVNSSKEITSYPFNGKN